MGIRAGVTLVGARHAAPLHCLSLAAGILAACSGAGGALQHPAGPTLFTRLPSSETGVAFRNDLIETREFNVFTYRNFYNGGGVAIGDLTGDSLPEIVLTANMDGPKLYLNQGQFHFRDVTIAGGLQEKNRWTTGVTLADVNGDGRLDIYVCHAGNGGGAARANALYINQGLNSAGVPTFREEARAYGIADTGYTTQAAFLDYDRDGDLDLFLIRNSPRPVASIGVSSTRSIRDPLGGHRLYRNDNGHFTDASARAGIYGSEIGFGLGIAVSDVNRDGWPDLYIANDFFERDYLYINRRDGTFGEVLDREMPVLSYFSMGLDIADINNDGWPDIYTTDMLPEDDHRLKTTSSFEGWDVYQAKLRNGFHYQFMRNMLQLNNGNGTFSDIGQLAGVARTDWSWSALIADLDLDGHKDIFVTNGLARDVTSQDYVAFLANDQTMRSATRGEHVNFLDLINAMSSTKLPDYAFRNNGGGDLTFTSVSTAWGLDEPNFSNGAAYGDLDGDGALDLVVNNVNDEAFIFRNNARNLLPGNHYLQVRLEGSGANRYAVGARVTLRSGERQFVQELQPTRGFQSSVDYVLTFGLGSLDTLESVTIDWPDGRTSHRLRVAANQLLTVTREGARHERPIREAADPPVFTDVTAQIALPFVHHENDFVDFDRERLIPKMISTEGPFVTVADVNGDELDDFFIGGAKDQPSALYVQRSDAGGRFTATNQQLFANDALSEDLGAAFIDGNLYVVTGGNEFTGAAPALQDRLYIGDGRGGFSKSSDGVPPAWVSGSRVAASKVFVFVGGRVVPGSYGTDPPSILLRNDGNGGGHFTDVTAQVAPELATIGMVTDALWIDVDGDKKEDLVVVGEWMPITVFRNTGTKLERMATPGLEHSAGWWNRIIAADFTSDGLPDFVIGNLGLNQRLRASASEPATMYVKDFDNNGVTEPIISCYSGGASLPLVLRDDLIKALPYLKSRFLKYSSYAGKTPQDIFGSQLGNAVFKKAETFATSLARNNGDGSFTLVPLPLEAQTAPVYGILASDFDQDGKLDLLLGGNFDGVKPDLARMSASFGLFLRGDGTGGFTPVRTTESGFTVSGQVRDIARLRTRAGELYIVARNNDRPLFFRATAARSVAAARSIP